MDPCTVETGLLRKKPCGHPGVTKCGNCERPLCSQHAVAQLNSMEKKTGVYLCAECNSAQREHEKSLAAVARSQEEKKRAAVAKAAMAAASAPPPVKKPAVPAPAAPAKEAPAGEKQESGAIEFTPGDGSKASGKVEYTPRKKDDPGYKGE